MSQSARRFQKNRDKENSRRATEEFPFERSERRPPSAKPIKALTDNQGRYINAIKANDITFGLGPAGTGKTWVAAALAADALRDREIERLIITRPAVEVGESIGYLPGEMEEKFDPYFAPVREVLIERLGQGLFEALLRTGKIVVQPIGFLRGWTFKHAVVILDEAQNTTPKQMKMFLTRIGEGGKLIINGDLAQSDIPGPNGLKDAVDRLDGIKSVKVITFRRDDIVRHGLVREITDRYEDAHDHGLPAFITG